MKDSTKARRKVLAFKKRVGEYERLLRELEDLSIRLLWVSRSLGSLKYWKHHIGDVESSQLKGQYKDVLKWKKHYAKMLERIISEGPDSF